MGLDGLNLMHYDCLGRLGVELESWRCRQACRHLAHFVVAVNEHRLCGFVAGSRLRTNIVSWRQRKISPVPKSSMVACVVIRVAAQNVEDNPFIQLPQSFCRSGKAVTDDFGQVLIAGIRHHHFIETEQGKCRYDGLSQPSLRFSRSNRSINKTSFPKAPVSFTFATLRPTKLASRMAMNSAFTTL
jgi:hypothetical protein